MPLQSQHLGKYDILDKLGEGGFGAVYRAVDTVLDRPVALKLLKPMLLADPVFLLRFRREAKAAAGLDHPNIVPIYDFGEVEGSYYLSMRYISGEPLDKLIAREGQLPVDRALQIAGQVAAALDYAHARGLLHRDVKPSNIIIGDGDHAFLTDFGLVRSVENSALTSASQVVGTAEYMAPEQLDTDRQDEVGPRTDLYAFGIVVYQMLTGRVPFSGSISAVIGSQLYKQPVSPRSLRPDLPPMIEAAVLKMLSKQSTERFASGQAFVETMEGAEEKARQEAERKVQEEVAAQAKAQAEESARRVAETAAAAQMVRQQAEAAARATGEAEERARQGAEARRKAEEAEARRQAEDVGRPKVEAEERVQRETAERARREAEAKAQAEAVARRSAKEAAGRATSPVPAMPTRAGAVTGGVLRRRLDVTWLALAGAVFGVNLLTPTSDGLEDRERRYRTLAAALLVLVGAVFAVSAFLPGVMGGWVYLVALGLAYVFGFFASQWIGFLIIGGMVTGLGVSVALIETNTVIGQPWTDVTAICIVLGLISAWLINRIARWRRGG